jgi:hypothetical protein
MKKTILFLLFLITITIGFNNLLYAQPRPNNTSADVITIDAISARTASLTTLDSLRMPHIVYFEIPLLGDDTKRILNSVLAGQIPALSLKTTNMQFQVMAEKDYTGISVTDIAFSDLNASSKEAARVRVKMQAPNMIEKPATNEVLRLTPMGRPAMCNTFKMTLGNLATQRVTSISNIRISRQTGGLSFTVSVARTDAKEWKDWFNGSIKDQKQEGTISWLDPSFNSIFTLQFQGVEITSVLEADGQGDNILVSSFTVHCRSFQVAK